MIQKIAFSIIANAIALHANEQIKGTDIYKQGLKQKLNLVIKELIKAEEKEFDKIDDADEEVTGNVTSSVMDVISYLSQEDFFNLNDFVRIHQAYKKSPKQINRIVNKILNN